MANDAANRHFRNLIHWQMGQELAVQIIALVDVLPRTKASDLLTAQLIRAAGSVPANIAEGYGRYSRAAYRNHLSIARGSLFETQSWLDLLLRERLITGEKAQQLDRECEELARVLTARMKVLDGGNGTAIREESALYEVGYGDDVDC